MSNVKKITGLALATAAAGLFATATVPTVAAKQEAKVHCVGINGCKGHSECATASNACKGMNACKGKGMTVTTAEDCKAKGGKIEKS